MKQLPRFLKKYFWDIDFEKLDKNIYQDFIIERILENGDEKATKWLFEYFKKPEIKKTFAKRQRISPKSLNYWSLILNIPKNKILCSQKQFQNKLHRTWVY